MPKFIAEQLISVEGKPDFRTYEITGKTLQAATLRGLACALEREELAFEMDCEMVQMHIRICSRPAVEFSFSVETKED